MLNSRSLFPLKLSVFFGMITGLYCTIRGTPIRDYLHYHLYNTASNILTGEIDRRILILTAILYVIWLLCLAGRTRSVKRVIIACAAIVAGGRLRGKARTAYQTVLICAVVIGSFLKLDVPSWFKQFDSLLIQTAFAQSKWQLMAAGAILGFGLVYLLNLWISSRRAAQTPETMVSVSDFMQWVGRVVSRIERQSVLYALAAVVVLSLNVIFAVFRLETAVSMAKRPNVIIIMADTLRADHVGCYGYHANTTPNIDRFAENGIRFDDATANSSWTTASVASFMTSQYPQAVLLKNANGVSGGTQPMSTHVVTIARALQDLGYSTGAVISNPQFGEATHGSLGFQFFNDCSVMKKSTSSGVFSIARNWIADRKNEKVFLFALFMDPHSPYRRHPGYDFDPGYNGASADEVSIKHWDTPSTVKCRLSHIEALYDSDIAYTDHYIGLLMSELKKNGLYDNSIVIFLSDHGEQFADHGGFFHGDTLYHEVVHVPLIVKLPNQDRKREVKGYFPLIDLFPTILSLIASDPSPTRPQGRPVDLTNLKDMRDEYIYAATSLYNKLRSVQNREYKYIFDLEKQKGQLFNLSTDPMEQRNIAAHEPRIASTLQKMLLVKEREASADQTYTLDQPGKALTPGEAEKLRSLGYLQ